MMDWIRSKVSGKRKRFKDEDFNLDISYITPRVLAMSFPASGLESCYRNKIGKVAQFLERNIIISKFKGEVKSYQWEDHHSPPIEMLFDICYDMFKYLNQNSQNVAVVHCNAGKGRTGTSIGCFLIYSGLSETAEDAIRYYGRKRFKTGLGITQPCQIRYVKYFEEIYFGRIKSPVEKILKSVRIYGFPYSNKKVVKVRTMNCIYNGKTEEGVKSYKSQNKINATYGKNFKVSSDEMGSYSSNPDHKLFGDMKEFNIEYEEPVLTKSKIPKYETVPIYQLEQK